jgi:hypothetical protein
MDARAKRVLISSFIVQQYISCIFIVVISFTCNIHSEIIKVGFVILIVCGRQVNVNILCVVLQIVSCHFGMPVVELVFPLQFLDCTEMLDLNKWH